MNLKYRLRGNPKWIALVTATALLGVVMPIQQSISGINHVSAASRVAFVGASGATETKAATSLHVNTSSATADDLLLISISVWTGASNQVKSVTDSAGNTYQRIGAWAIDGSHSDGEAWYTHSATAVTSVTVHTPSPHGHRRGGSGIFWSVSGARRRRPGCHRIHACHQFGR